MKRVINAKRNSQWANASYNQGSSVYDTYYIIKLKTLAYRANDKLRLCKRGSAVEENYVYLSIEIFQLKLSF